jgi:hypothetical protein
VVKGTIPDWGKKLEEHAAYSTEALRKLLNVAGSTGTEIICEFQPDVSMIAGVEIDGMLMNVATQDPELEKRLVAAQWDADTLIAAMDDSIVLGQRESSLRKAIAAVQGHADVELLNDDPMVVSMARKVGLDNNILFFFSPARAFESQMRFQLRARGMVANAPQPMPFATPIAFGSKIMSKNTVRGDVYIAREAITEFMTVMMGAFGGM